MPPRARVGLDTENTVVGGRRSPVRVRTGIVVDDEIDR